MIVCRAPFAAGARICAAWPGTEGVTVARGAVQNAATDGSSNEVGVAVHSRGISAAWLRDIACEPGHPTRTQPAQLKFAKPPQNPPMRDSSADGGVSASGAPFAKSDVVRRVRRQLVALARNTRSRLKRER